MSETENLTPRKAYELYNDEGLSNSQIGERFDVSESTVSRRRKEYREMQETATETVEKEIQNLDLSDHIDDEEPENNPYEETECPACDEQMLKPDTAGEHDCPNCGATLLFSEDEI